jgi:hypothetical protein
LIVFVQADTLERLIRYVDEERFKGYDPYDTLNSWIPFHRLGKAASMYAIQFQKRNPLNIRPIIGIQKTENPKAMGLFLRAFSILCQLQLKSDIREKAEFLFEWLNSHFSRGYSGKCWGYPFPWDTVDKFVKPFMPSSVVTGTVCKGVWEYYRITRDPRAPALIEDASKFLLNDLKRVTDETGQCISYTPIQRDLCYNASLLAGEVLAMCYVLTGNKDLIKICTDLVRFVIARQKPDGRWNYSLNEKTGEEREQIDFHQGYILESIFNILQLLRIDDPEWTEALLKGALFYRQEQFFSNGRSLWRIPREYPVDIHNQSQGIIIFSLLRGYDPDFYPFARTITEWTTNHMQDQKGYFYYRKNRHFMNRISYIRWSQAWMMVALAELERGKVTAV